LPFVDDPTVLDTEVLLRRIPHPEETTADPKAAQGIRPRSSAFDPNRDKTPMSVLRLTILQQVGLDPGAVMLGDFPHWGIVSFNASLIRDFGKGLAPDVTDEDGPAHAIIEDLTGGQKSRLAKLCEWYVFPGTYVPA
jgi:hypothetical protein